jgi:peptide/nickel transport system permease protein
MYIAKRIAQAIITFLAVVSLSFVMIKSMPGGPVAFIRARVMQSQGANDMSMQQLYQLAESYTNLRVDEPLYIQYVHYVLDVMQGDLGQSYIYGAPVTEIIAKAAPWTAFLLTNAIIVTTAAGIILGAVMAYTEGSKFDIGSTVVSMFMNSVPYYVAAIMLVYWVGYQWQVLPATGTTATGTTAGFNLPFIVGVIKHSILPIASLVLTGFGGVALTMRGNAMQEIGEDYIRVAHLRGVPGRRIATRYVGRNALLPMYTGLLISIGFMFGGSVILEEIFAYQGLGYYLLEAINARDYSLMMGCFLLITIAVVICTLIADLTYSKIDPRIDEPGSKEAY